MSICHTRNRATLKRTAIFARGGMLNDYGSRFNRKIIRRPNPAGMADIAESERAQVPEAFSVVSGPF